jgi:hypothetical protein
VARCKTARPSDRLFRKETMQGFRPQLAVNPDVASSHAAPVGETVGNARMQLQGSFRNEPRNGDPHRRGRHQGGGGKKSKFGMVV